MKKNNIVLVGMMGCGKTTISKLLGKRLRKNVVDLDEYLVNKYGMTIPEMFSISEEYFRNKESECCKDISKLEDMIVSTGGGVILRQENIKYLKKNGIIIYIDRPIHHILKDVDISSRPLLKDGPNKLYELYHQRHELYLQASDYHIFNDGTLDKVVEEILKRIDE